MLWQYRRINKRKMKGDFMTKRRYIMLTDIFHGFEVDDIQSLIRLLLYSNEIEIVAMITNTSCFVKKNKPEHEQIIHDIIDAYGKVKPNLDCHTAGYPTADYLHSVTVSGISSFGLLPGWGFAHKRYENNPGVLNIMQVADMDDDRPIYVGLWSGANTLAQAIWQYERTRTPEQFNRFLSKLRIYGISDQDHAVRWIRKKYGNKLYFITSPSKGSWFGNYTYYKATWPGISGDKFDHGSEDGINKTKGFSGADFSLIDNDWIKKNVIEVSDYGKLYPYPKFLTEGDSPSFMWIIPNGLNNPERVDYGGWGGRFKKYLPKKSQFGVTEKYPVWTVTSDTVMGNDGVLHNSPQATIWRWRKDFQNDFAARMQWTKTDVRSGLSHAPEMDLSEELISVMPGDIANLLLDVKDVDGKGLDISWLVYTEAGTLPADCKFTLSPSEDKKSATIKVLYMQLPAEIHIIARVQGKISPCIVKYKRFIVCVK